MAISRAEHEAKIYTNDKEKLPEAMGRVNVKEMALEINRAKEIETQKLEREKNNLSNSKKPSIQTKKRI